MTNITQSENKDSEILGSEPDNYPMAQPSTIQITTTPEETVSQPPAAINNQSIQYIPPIQYVVSDDQNPSSINVTEQMVKCHQYSSSVRCLSIFDIVILMFYTFSNPLTLILLVFPLYGYYGSVHYNVFMTKVYLCYQLIACFINAIFLLVVVDQSNNENRNINIALSVLNLCFNIYFAMIIKTFVVCLTGLSEHDITSLRLIRFIGNR